MKKSIILFIVLLLLLNGCGATVHTDEIDYETQEEEIKIGMSFDSFVIERWQKDRDVFVSTAKDYGAEVNIQNANGDLEEQIKQIEYFIEQKVDVIVIICIDSNGLTEVVKKAKDAGIKVVAYDRMINNADIDLYISFDNEKVGELMAKALIHPDMEDQKVLMLCGPLTDNNVLLVQKGFTKVMDENNVQILDIMYADGWKAELASSYIYENIDKVMKADGIMCGNDNLATMAVHALAEKQLAGKIDVVGQDGDLEACLRIVEGTQKMTVYMSVSKLAREAAIYSIRLAKGEELTELEKVTEDNYQIPFCLLSPQMVNKQNIDEVIVEGGVHLKEDVYLNVHY